MVGLLIGGALKGFGEGKMKEIEAKRKQALEDLRYERDLRAAGDERAFRSSENDKQIGAQRDLETMRQEGQDRRYAQTRVDNADTVVTEEGDTKLRVGDTVRGIKDEEGNPVKVRDEAAIKRRNEAITKMAKSLETDEGLTTEEALQKAVRQYDYLEKLEKLPRPTTQSEYDKIKEGEQYAGSDGKIRVKGATKADEPEPTTTAPAQSSGRGSGGGLGGGM